MASAGSWITGPTASEFVAAVDCGCRILGHGVQTPAGIFCGAHCARKDTNADVNDRYPVPAGG
jgi:hypothetical protein